MVHDFSNLKNLSVKMGAGWNYNAGLGKMLGKPVGEEERPGRTDDLYVFRQEMETRGRESNLREKKGYVSSSRENL